MLHCTCTGNTYTLARMQANDALRAFKLKEVERERQADLAIEAYAEKKAGMLAERKRREAAAAAAKEAQRKAMVRPAPLRATLGQHLRALCAACRDVIA